MTVLFFSFLSALLFITSILLSPHFFFTSHPCMFPMKTELPEGSVDPFIRISQLHSCSNCEKKAATLLLAANNSLRVPPPTHKTNHHQCAEPVCTSAFDQNSEIKALLAKLRSSANQLSQTNKEEWCLHSWTVSLVKIL